MKVQAEFLTSQIDDIYNLNYNYAFVVNYYLITYYKCFLLFQEGNQPLTS